MNNIEENACPCPCHEADARIGAILQNYAEGKYSLEYLKDLLKRGRRHIEELGLRTVDKKLILNLTHIEAAIHRIESAAREEKDER